MTGRWATLSAWYRRGQAAKRSTLLSTASAYTVDGWLTKYFEPGSMCSNISCTRWLLCHTLDDFRCMISALLFQGCSLQRRFGWFCASVFNYLQRNICLLRIQRRLKRDLFPPGTQVVVNMLAEVVNFSERWPDKGVDSNRLIRPYWFMQLRKTASLTMDRDQSMRTSSPIKCKPRQQVLLRVTTNKGHSERRQTRTENRGQRHPERLPYYLRSSVRTTVRAGAGRRS